MGRNNYVQSIVNVNSIYYYAKTSERTQCIAQQYSSHDVTSN